jgi:signal transduction histidine kinase
MERINFTVDSALLKELGERLVGKPHVALAELVKNSYDADASKATIKFALEEDRIEVRDDGHGMNFDGFRDFWMRIGTTHKVEAEKRESRELGRTMTGSKGVGRLAVQLLAGKLQMITVPKEGKGQWLEASVNWAEAVEVGDLVNASAEYRTWESLPPFKQGTRIILSELKDKWTKDEIRSLAAELWRLQPPFRSVPLVDRFEIEFQSTEREFEKAFKEQIRAILSIWKAKFVGKCRDGEISLSLEFDGESPQTYTYHIADFPHNFGHFDKEKNLNETDFEVRIFKLTGRQKYNIKVDDARDYLFEYGGVHVYDGGFRLPYYGSVENDWLRIEFDHSHRRFTSQLLPKELQDQYIRTQRLRFLPTLGRVFGVVKVNTSREPNLDIMITRDRLAQDSTAFQDLVAVIRYAFDLYAYEEARHQYKPKKIEPVSSGFERIEQALEEQEQHISKPVYLDLREEIRKAISAETVSRRDALKATLEKMGFLGPLATAGISTAAFQHELMKQFGLIEEIIEKIKNIETDDDSLQQSLDELATDLSSWLERARVTNALFSYLADAENITQRERFRATTVIEEVRRQVRFFSRGIEIDTTGIDEEVFLPEASLAEWSAIFQNIFTNAFNAMIDSEKRLLKVSSRVEGRSHEILVQDTGSGVDLRDADRLFEPFVRGLQISEERRALGYGGTGLGLTIVRLLADGIGCRAGFVEPEEGFETAFSLSWREMK